jgi:hypothetical protein
MKGDDNMFRNEHIVYEADATRYEINVSFILNSKSDYDYQFLVSLVNFGECFFESDLNFIAEVIHKNSGRFSSTDAVNIQNALSEIPDLGVRKVRFDRDYRRFEALETV